jgi:acetyl esterase/lipase
MYAYSEQFSDQRRIDLYPPPGPGRGAALLFVHGGGWRGGGRGQWRPVAEYCTARGFFCASMSYRLAPAHRFPAAVEDVRLGMAWLRAHAESFGFAPDRVGAVGSSSGGHLVALLATLGPDDPLGVTAELADRDTRPQAAFCYCPVVSLHSGRPESALLEECYLDFLGVTEAQDPRLYAQASPVDRVTGAEPPFLFLHGDADTDVPPAQSLLMAERLRAAGVAAEVLLLPGVEHGFGYGVDTPAQIQAAQAVVSFGEEWLARQA